MQHPLVRPSLAPYGFGFRNQTNRLKWRAAYDPYYVNPERHIALYWAHVHRIDSAQPWPIETIIHEIMPAMASANRIQESDFEFSGKRYYSRDIAVLSTIVYWFGTSVGHAFVDIPEIPIRRNKGEWNHVDKLRTWMEARDYVQMWTHECTSECGKKRYSIFVDSHDYQTDTATPRDYALAEALMRWLDRRAGKDFIEFWEAKLRTKVNEKSQQRLNDMLRAAKKA